MTSQAKTWHVSLFILIISFFSFPFFLQAQFDTTTNTAVIAIDPQYPEPFTEVTLNLQAYAYELNGTQIFWYINGVEDISKKNNLEATLQVGDYDDSTEVIVRLVLPGGSVVETRRSITPNRVDVVIESDTLVPLFYKGRALPSPGSTIRTIAIPVSGYSPSELTYTWRLNNTALHKGPVRGQDTAEFELPFGGDAYISVEVSDPSGTIFAKKSIQVNIVEPEMYFYETNALRGLTRLAINSSYQLIGDEVTVRAEPYYMDKHIFEKDVHMEWEINGRAVQNPNIDPQNITLRNNGGSGRFEVEFHIRNLENLLQGIREDFTLTF